MNTYCLVYRKNTGDVNSKMIKTKNDRLQLKFQFVEIKKIDL